MAIQHVFLILNCIKIDNILVICVSLKLLTFLTLEVHNFVKYHSMYIKLTVLESLKSQETHHWKSIWYL